MMKSILVLLALVAVSCSKKQPVEELQPNNGTVENQTCMLLSEEAKSGNFVVDVQDNEIKVMSYNVENLFDTEHDVVNGVDKSDWEYLPLGHSLKSECENITSEYYKKKCKETDWTQEKLDLKLQQIARAIKAQGSLPDILGLQEVENENVVSQLADVLGYEGYKVTVGPDKRGIEVAVLYNEDKIRYIDRKDIRIEFEDPEFQAKPTRDILATYFSIGNGSEILGVYVNHWPSQAAPAEKRVVVAEALYKHIKKDTKRFKKKNFNVIALGDFNVIPNDYPHPLRTVLMDRDRKYHLEQVHWLYNNASVPWDEKKTKYKYLDPDKAYKYMPRGTYFYFPNLSWDILDHIHVSRNMRNGEGVEVVPESYRIVAPPVGSRKLTYLEELDGGEIEEASAVRMPKRHNKNTLDPKEAGVSDHFPVIVKIRFE